jgi:hypothetical protein
MSRGWFRIGLVVAAVVAIAAIGFALLRGGSASPVSLAAGDCIDLANTTAITNIPRVSCTDAHTGEVFHVFNATGSAGAYPSDADWGTLIYPICDPAFDAYTGTPVETRTDIDYIYVVPTSDRWAGGDRRVTCVIQSLDGAPLTKSYRADG